MTTTRPQTYDAVARALHWLTVLGFIGILSTITVWTIYDGEEWGKSLFGVHKSIGFITLLVIAVRIVWALLNASKRPAADSLPPKQATLPLRPYARRSRYRHDPPIRRRSRPIESIRRPSDAGFA